VDVTFKYTKKENPKWRFNLEEKFQGKWFKNEEPAVNLAKIIRDIEKSYECFDLAYLIFLNYQDEEKRRLKTSNFIHLLAGMVVFITMKAYERFNWGYSRTITVKERIKLVLKTLIENKSFSHEWTIKMLD